MLSCWLGKEDMPRMYDEYDPGKRWIQGVFHSERHSSSNGEIEPGFNFNPWVYMLVLAIVISTGVTSWL